MRENSGRTRFPEAFAPGEVRFVLVESLSGGNIGSAARAMKNLGFTRMELVRPGCDPLGEEARRMAVDARDLLAAARVQPSLDAALEGARTVVGATARAGKHRRPHRRLDALAADLVREGLTADLAIVFGREDHGLTDLELDRCTHLVHLPGHADYPSFNLAQAVLLVAYELRLARLGPDDDQGGEPPAEYGEREAFLIHLEQALSAIGYLGRDTAEVIMRRLRRIFGRAHLTHDEVKLFRGMARQTLWAAERAGLEIPAPRRGDAADEPQAGPASPPDPSGGSSEDGETPD